MTLTDTIQTGAEVFTSDGERLGVVGELRGGAFRIDSGFLPHYWLRAETAVYGDARSIRLAFPMREFGAELVPAPTLPADLKGRADLDSLIEKLDQEGKLGARHGKVRDRFGQRVAGGRTLGANCERALSWRAINHRAL